MTFPIVLCEVWRRKNLATTEQRVMGLVAGEVPIASEGGFLPLPITCGRFPGSARCTANSPRNRPRLPSTRCYARTNLSRTEDFHDTTIPTQSLARGRPKSRWPVGARLVFGGRFWKGGITFVMKVSPHQGTVEATVRYVTEQYAWKRGAIHKHGVRIQDRSI